MKKQLYGSPLSGSPEKKKKKYMEPVLSEVAFTTEKGFSSSVPLTGETSIKATTVDEDSTTWY